MNNIEMALASLNLSQLLQFHFLRPWWLLSIIPLALFYRTMLVKDDTLKQWRGHMSAKMIKHLSQQENQNLKFNPKNLFAMFAVIGTLVMAGPTWTKKTSPFFVDDSVLIIALDVSESMKSTDIQPSRLIRAKQKIVKLLETRGDAKTGLIVYAGSAHVAMPITQDRKMILHFLDVLDTDLLPLTQSIPQSVITPSQALLAQAKSTATLLLLTDKTNQTTLESLPALFQDKRHQLIVWAIGENPNSGLPSSTGISDTQLNQLRSLADKSQGSMISFTHNNNDIDEVSQAIASNISSVNDNAQPWYDQGYPLLFLLIPLQVLWFRRGWTMQW